MSKNLDKKLLAECFDAIVNENDVAKATRLFKRHWDLAAKNSYALLESADEDFEIDDMGDDFNNEMANEIGSDAEEKFNQLQIAIDELEDKFPAEMTDEVSAKFDDLRNAIDEMKLADSEDGDMSDEASVALEDLRGEFEVAGELDDEVVDLFDEISSGIQGDATMEEVDVADEEVEDEDNSEEMVEEAEDSDLDLEYEDSAEDSEEAEEDADLAAEDEGMADEARSEDDIKDELKYTADELVALIDELEADEGSEEDLGDFEEDEGLKESWSKISDPRKKLTSEEEGVNKKGTMNFGKLPGLKLDKKAGLGTSSSESKGVAPSVKHKTQSNVNNGAKQWRKTEKPANKPASGKSLMGN